MGGRIVDRAVLEPRKNSPDAASHIERERPLENQKAVGGRRSPDLRHDSRLVRAGPVGIVNGVVDAVDRPCLGRIRRRRQREVGVAPSLEQNGDLIVHAAPSPIGTRVVEGPVAVHEAERDGAIAAAAEEPVL